MRGLAAELKNIIGREYSVSSTFMPGAGLQSITELAKSEIATLTKSETVIVCGGSNDACKNESQTGLNCLNNFSNLRNNTNIMIISIPQRHDLSSESCVSKGILAFNRKLHKLMKNKELVKVLDCNIPREGYTRHGQHHNPKGKAMLALQIMQELTKQSEVNTINPNPIPMAWMKSSSDPTSNGSAAGPTSKVLKEGEKPSTIPIPNECVLADIKEVIRQPISIVSAVSEDSGNESSNPNNRTSSSDPSPNGSAAGPSTKVLKEGEKPSTIPIPNECVLVDTKEVISQPTSVISVVSEDSGNESSNPHNRMSIRRKKIPLYRGNDFLWG
jgi:hypothetical protein